MELFRKKSQCCGCMACVDACSKGAIRIAADSEGFLYPQVQRDLCTDCGRCRTVCPLTARDFPTRSHRYFAAQARDPALRRASTSGAVFPVLAQSVLDSGGVVYGAGFDASMTVTHRRVDTPEKLEPLLQSKYVQSETRGIFRMVREDLCAKRQVLFVGTPCQTEALRRFLGREYPDLFLADLVCYGVPSPGVWASYKSYLEKRFRGKLTAFYFRDKRRQDNGHTVSWHIDGREYWEDYSVNPFTSMYSHGCMLRPSCHACPFTTAERHSDITLGDFWGIGEVSPAMEDGMGTSLVILHSRRGESLWKRVREQFSCLECTKKQALQFRLMYPSRLTFRRSLFFFLHRTVSFAVLAELFRRKPLRRLWYVEERGP